MSNAGQEVVAGRIPGESIGTPSSRTSNVGTFTTTETEIDTITVPVVSGRTYRIVLDAQVQSSVADGGVRGRIREDSVPAGTQLALRHAPTNAIANQSFLLRIEARYVAVSTANKTFKASAIRQAGTGNITAVASADAPTLFYVEYVSG